MTELTGAIVAHDLKAIEELVAADPALVNQRENGWLPIEWAAKTGNVVTFARAARIMGSDIKQADATRWLQKYMTIVTSTEYEQITKDAGATMVWASLFSGGEYKVDRWKRPLIASSSHADDLRFLIKAAGIGCAAQLREISEYA